MSELFDDAKKYAEAHPEQVDKGLETAGEEAEKRTGDRYDKEIDKGVAEAEQHIDGEKSK